MRFDTGAIVSVKIFISCVSKEFLTYRDQLRGDLTRHNVEVKVQEDLKDLGTLTLDKLDVYIRACDAVIHLVGEMTGAMAKPASMRAILAKYPDIAGKLPPLGAALDRGEEISYTQWEAWLALLHDKPLLIAQAGADAENLGPEFAPTAASRAAQQAHLARLRAVERYPGCTFVNVDQLAKQIAYTTILDLLAQHRVGVPSGNKQSHPSPLHQLPADIADFAGRGAQMEKLLEVLSARDGHVAISAIDGMGGLGKTALAVHVAHRLTARYPDSQIVVNMAGTGAAPLLPAQGLTWVIRVFEPLMRLPETVAELRPIYLHALRGKRVLLLLDNAHDGDQVAPLLPPEDCALIVTSRRRIAVTGVVRVDLDLLAPEEAMGLLGAIVGESRATAAELSRLAELCGRLPLALRIAGMFLQASPHWSAARFIVALADERKRLGRLRLEGSADLDVAASLALSVGELRRARPDLADRWHELAVFPASFDTAAAGSVWEQPEEVADDALGVLLLRSMVLYDPAQQRWRLHDLMRDLAGGRTAAELPGVPADLAARLTAARGRHAGHYQAVLAAANDLYLKGSPQMMSGLALFDRERRNIETGQAWAAEAAVNDLAVARLCVSYPNAGAYVLSLRQHPRQRIGWLEQAAAAAREIGDRRGEGNVLGNLGIAYAALGETRRAIAYYDQSLATMREIGDRQGQGKVLGNLGTAYAALGDTRSAIECYKQNLVIARANGDRRSEGNALGNLGIAYAELGEPRRAIEYYEQVLTIVREIGDRRSEGNALGNLGIAYAELGEPRRAIEHHQQSLVIAREIGDRRSEGNALGNLGVAYAALGDTRHAIEHHEHALIISRSIGDRGAEGQDLGNLGNVYVDLGEPRRAIAVLREALAIFEAIKSPHAAQVRTTIARLNNEEGA
jgi:tetratricopeptide (TPR) repeat protein